MSESKLSIVITAWRGGYKAGVDDFASPGHIWYGYGPTVDSAIGDLIRNHSWVFNTECVYPEEKAGVSGLNAAAS